MKYFDKIINQGAILNKSIDRENSVCIFAINTISKLYIWDNFKSENNQSFDFVYDKMKQRIDKNFNNNFIDMEVYNWRQKSLRYEFSGSQEARAKLCTVSNAKVKLKIFMPTGMDNHEFFHFENQLHLPEIQIVQQMKHTLLSKFNKKFNVAIFYKTINNSFDTEIEKITGKFVNQYNAVG